MQWLKDVSTVQWQKQFIAKREETKKAYIQASKLARLENYSCLDPDWLLECLRNSVRCWSKGCCRSSPKECLRISKHKTFSRPRYWMRKHVKSMQASRTSRKQRVVEFTFHEGQLGKLLTLGYKKWSFSTVLHFVSDSTTMRIVFGTKIINLYHKTSTQRALKEGTVHNDLC